MEAAVSRVLVSVWLPVRASCRFPTRQESRGASRGKQQHAAKAALIYNKLLSW